jgi:hypothetical protein
MIRANSGFFNNYFEKKMKTRSKFILIGILSLLAGSAFTTPLLLSELDIIPFWTIPEGPKADLGVSVVYANFTFQGNSSTHNEHIINYYVVLNMTNLSNLPTKLSYFGFAGLKNVTFIPSALGGFHVTHEGEGLSGSSFGSMGPAEGYLGHVGAGRVEGLWLDDEWLNTTWVPEGGLDEIWRSENILPPKELENIWEPNWYHNADPYGLLDSEKYDYELPPFTTFGGTRSNGTHYYTYSGTRFNYEGGNYWIEGVPLIEYIVNNEVKSTIIYHDGSWIDVTGRVKTEERAFIIAKNLLVKSQTVFNGYSGENSSIPVGSSITSSTVDGNLSFIYGFDKTWAPHQSRLILLKGFIDVGDFWGNSESLEEEITFYVEAENYVDDNIVNGVVTNTVSTSFELKTAQLSVSEATYLYNSILLDDQTFVTASSSLEVFVQGIEK